MTTIHKEKFSYFKSRNKHIIEAYKSGATIQELANRHQYTEFTIKRITGHREPRKSQSKGARERIKLRNQNIVGDAKRGHTIEQMCKHYDLGEASILDVLRKNNYGIKQMKADKEMRELMERHKARLDRINKTTPAIPPKKYSPEWTELQWKEGYEREMKNATL